MQGTSEEMERIFLNLNLNISINDQLGWRGTHTCSKVPFPHRHPIEYVPFKCEEIQIWKRIRLLLLAATPNICQHYKMDDIYLFLCESTKKLWRPSRDTIWKNQIFHILAQSSRSIIIAVCLPQARGPQGMRGMRWLRLAGSIKLQVSFAEHSLFYWALLQKRPIIFLMLLTEASPYYMVTRRFSPARGASRAVAECKIGFEVTRRN